MLVWDEERKRIKKAGKTGGEQTACGWHVIVVYRSGSVAMGGKTARLSRDLCHLKLERQSMGRLKKVIQAARARFSISPLPNRFSRQAPASRT